MSYGIGRGELTRLFFVVQYLRDENAWILGLVKTRIYMVELKTGIHMRILYNKSLVLDRGLVKPRLVNTGNRSNNLQVHPFQDLRRLFLNRAMTGAEKKWLQTVEGAIMTFLNVQLQLLLLPKLNMAITKNQRLFFSFLCGLI